jgi:outer membrane putative beta-barrel porin/alpha-amylase
MSCTRAGLLFVLLLLTLLADSRPSCAQMPFYTDDTSTTETGKFHVEVFAELDRLPSSQSPDLRQSTTNIKLNFSPIQHLELDLDAPYIQISRAPGAASASGVGDTELGTKWTFREAPPDSDLATFAASLYVEFPTGNERRGLGSGLTDYWLNFIAQKRLSPTTRYNVNVGVLFAGNTSTGAVGIQTQRGQVYTGGLSVLHDVSSRLTLGAEIYGGISDGAGSDRSQLQVLLGGQYAIRNGLSVSLGVLGGRFGATPRIGGQVGVSVDFPDATQPQGRWIQ